jgi:hypothetical protein
VNPIPKHCTTALSSPELVPSGSVNGNCNYFIVIFYLKSFSILPGYVSSAANSNPTGKYPVMKKPNKEDVA